MTQFKVKPICVAVMLMTTYAGAAVAQEAAPSSQQANPAADKAAPMQTVQVTGLRQSIRSAEQIKRDAEQVVDSINADDIGKFPDRQAGDALQRIAGVQVGRDNGETDSVIIRGLPDVSTTLDGNEYFTGTGRRLSYQDLPVQSIGGLDVYKSVTPNIQEGGIAGSIDIRLHAPFDFKGFTATAYAEDRRDKINGSSASPVKNNPGAGFLVSNRWQTGVGEMGFLFDVSGNKDNWGYPVQWVDRPTNVYDVTPAGVGTRLNQASSYTAQPGDSLGELPNIGGIYNAGERTRSSVHGAFQWKINPSLEASAQYLGTGYHDRHGVNYILSIVTWTPTLQNVKLAPQGSYCNLAAGIICPIEQADAPAKQFGGPYDWDPYTATSTWGVKEHTNTNYLNLGLKYNEGPWKVTTNLAYNKSLYVNDTVIVDQQIPGASASVYTYGADGHGGYTAITSPGSAHALTDPSQFVLRGLVENWGESDGSELQWHTDGIYRLNSGILSALTGGVRLASRSVSFHGAQGNYDFSGTRPTPIGQFGPSFETTVPGLDRLGGPWVTPSADFLIDNANTVRQAYGAPAGRVPEDPTRLFDQRERTLTTYLTARFKTGLGSVEFSGDAGARVVRADRNLKGDNQIGGVVTPVELDTSETNLLPSFNGVIGWTEKLQSHVAIGKTITRPDFASLNPALSLIPPTVNAPGAGSAGNPYLKPTTSTNTDATLEYYFPKNGYVQLALFQRNIDGYLQSVEDDETINGQVYRVTRPQNSGKGRLRGAEFGIQKFFDFLPEFWKDFGAQFNYTLINGSNQTIFDPNNPVFTNTPLVGVAKQNYNFALLYEGNGLTGRLAATHRGDYVDQIAEPPFGQNRIVAATTFVDLSIGYELTKHVSLQFDGINLTKAKYESYLGSPLLPRDIRYNPTTYGVSVRVRM